MPADVLLAHSISPFLGKRLLHFTHHWLGVQAQRLQLQLLRLLRMQLLCLLKVHAC